MEHLLEDFLLPARNLVCKVVKNKIFQIYLTWEWETKFHQHSFIELEGTRAMIRRIPKGPAFNESAVVFLTFVFSLQV